MATFNKAEFWQELEATDEEFVKNKLALGGYSASKKKIVVEWLNRKEERRRQAREVMNHEVALKAVRWNMFTTIATFFAVVIAGASLYLAK